MKKIIILFSLAFWCVNSFSSSKLPRQKIYMKGLVKSSVKSNFKVDYLKTFTHQKINVFDPYQEDKLVTFSAFSLCNVFDQFSIKKAKKLVIVAINDYTREFERSSCEKSNIFIAFEESGHFFSADKMGPVRIVKPSNKAISAAELAKEGVDWVWMVRDFIFK
ncbi:hypothetical protein HBN50_11570 [Halobacteriovorax sp. GB3]|uniref:hypothetical protein n=1 Tax=Halobacteriovorax sp. GB3 TaxID=2719615 RepID=UPI00236080EB|nr:hypothetical protein [Halobacteriovorax sp. GB3]MDD0853740.1 hypothetical protein [Halobacteriovorax sp. GB3]